MSFGGRTGLPCMKTPMKTNMTDLGPTCRGVAALLDAITDSRLAGPTPCPGCSVGDMIAHLVGLTVAFRDAAKKELGPTTDTPPGRAVPVLGADWRDVLPRQLDDLATAWRSPAAWQGGTRAGGVDMPGQVAGLVALNEVLIHGWDLARSTGQPYEPDEAGLRGSYALLSPAAGNAQLPSDGPFGPPVEVPQDAPLLDRVIGLSGRRPEWKPGL
jgi:uncharacterized protein (TIGR03086 family)